MEKKEFAPKEVSGGAAVGFTTPNLQERVICKSTRASGYSWPNPWPATPSLPSRPNELREKKRESRKKKMN